MLVGVVKQREMFCNVEINWHIKNSVSCIKCYELMHEVHYRTLVVRQTENNCKLLRIYFTVLQNDIIKTRFAYVTSIKLPY